METRSGKVVNILRDAKVSTKTGKPYTVHSVVLDSGDTIEVGFKQPYKTGASFNSEVEFAYGKWKEVRPLGSASPPSSSTSGQDATPSPAPMQFPIPKSSKELAIIRQNALTNAMNAVNNYDGGDRNALEKLDEYAERVINVAYKFAEFSSGQREIRLSKELAGDSED